MAISTSPDSFLEIYSRLGSTSVGNPIEVKDKDGIAYNIDYLLTCQEIFFLKTNIPTTSREEEIKSVCEIGAGFGRTCHGVLLNFPEVVEYTIIDLPEMLLLQSEYHLNVLPPDLYKKIKFQEFNAYQICPYNLEIQIDAFQEMEAGVIDTYYRDIIDLSDNVFIKNPIGKYKPEIAGLDLPTGTYVPFELGRSKSVLNIWNLDEVNSHINAHNANYAPSFHTLARWELDRLFPHFVLQLYVRNSSGSIN